jgi:hypothetical protein
VVDFFNEVDEDVRGQQMREAARKYLPWAGGAVALVLLAAGGYWGWDAWRGEQSDKASMAYERAVKAQTANDQAGAQRALGAVTEGSSPAYKALAYMQQGAVALSDNKPQDAVKFFDEAAKAAPDEIMGDAARLKAVFVLMDTAPFATVEERLKPLMEDGRPYRPLAREALAMAKLQAGRAKDARGDFVALSLGLDAPEDVRARAQAAIQMIDSGTAAKLPGIAKAAAALPSQPAVSPFPQAGAPAPQAGAAPQ